jgi:hypothetical protein
MCTKFWLESLKGKDHLEDLGVDGRMILGHTGIVLDGVGWINLAQYKGWWQAFVNMVMNLQVT